MNIYTRPTAADTRRILAPLRQYARRYLAPASVRGEIAHYGVEESRARSTMRYVLGFGTALYSSSLAMVDPRTRDAFIDMSAAKLQRHGIGSRHKNHAADIAAGIAPEVWSEWERVAREVLAELRVQNYSGYVRGIDGRTEEI